MDGLIGLDAHASSCTLGEVRAGGERVDSHAAETAVRESRGLRDDRRDAFGLADALRLGPIRTAQLLPIVVTPYRSG